VAIEALITPSVRCSAVRTAFSQPPQCIGTFTIVSIAIWASLIARRSNGSRRAA
jgi:hypothetical protein